MKKIIYACLSVLFCLMAYSCGSKSQPVEKSEKVIIAYIAGFQGQVDINRISAEKITHINYAFVDVQDGKAVLTNEATDTTNFRLLNQLKLKNPDLKIFISIGGWTWSGNFSDAVLTEDGRKVFAKSAVEIMHKYDLDGVDVDWEYPTIPGLEGNVYRPEDKQNFTLMFQAIREELDALEKQTNREYLLTAAVGGFQKYIDNTEMDKVQQYLDYVNVMTYDYYNSDKIAHHTNLYASDRYDSPKSADAAIKAFIAAGVPAEKLVMGIAFYGRTFIVEDGSEDGLTAAIVEQINGDGYTFIKDSIIADSSYLKFRDEKALAPYLFNAEKNIFITYEDEKSVAEKCRYVIANRMAGVMFWEYNSDLQEYLLDEINETIR